jgi:prolyl-tRNA editing enzyme YbaK/EbsC (Cys-tRNA(Pro) deacylase)
MDEQKTGAVNGAKGSARQNDSEAKVNKTLLLRQQIEENRYLTLNKSEKSVNFKPYVKQDANAAKRKRDLQQQEKFRTTLYSAGSILFWGVTQFINRC